MIPAKMRLGHRIVVTRSPMAHFDKQVDTDVNPLGMNTTKTPKARRKYQAVVQLKNQASTNHVRLEKDSTIT